MIKYSNNQHLLFSTNNRTFLQTLTSISMHYAKQTKLATHDDVALVQQPKSVVWDHFSQVDDDEEAGPAYELF
jgi:hypothetical protein